MVRIFTWIRLMEPGGYTTVNEKSGWIEMKYAESTRNREWTGQTENSEQDRSDAENWYYI